MKKTIKHKMEIKITAHKIKLQSDNSNICTSKNIQNSFSNNYDWGDKLKINLFDIIEINEPEIYHMDSKSHYTGMYPHNFIKVLTCDNNEYVFIENNEYNRMLLSKLI